MNKVFLCTLSLQEVKPRIYDPVDNSRLTIPYGTAFPVLLPMWGYVDAGETVTVRPIIIGHAFSEENLSPFQREVAEFERKKGATCLIEPIRVPDDESLEAHIALFRKLCEVIGREDTVYLDITYGTKPTPIVLFTAMNYLNKTRDVDIACISYGRVTDYRDTTSHGLSYDVTSLFRMNTIVDILVEQQVSNPDEVLLRLLRPDCP